MVSFNNLTSAFDQKEIKNAHQGQNSLESCTVYKRSQNRMEKAHSTYMIFWNLHFSRYWVILQGLQNSVRMGMSWWTWRAGRGMGTEPWERAGPQPFAAISVEQGLRWRWQSRTRGSALQVWALQAMKHPCSPPAPKTKTAFSLTGCIKSQQLLPALKPRAPCVALGSGIGKRAGCNRWSSPRVKPHFLTPLKAIIKICKELESTTGMTQRVSW